MKRSMSTRRRNSPWPKVSGSTTSTMPDREPMCWTVGFDRHRPLETLEVKGTGGAIKAGPNGKDVVIQLPYELQTVVEGRPGGATVFGGSAVLPVFARVRGDRVELSNRAA